MMLVQLVVMLGQDINMVITSNSDEISFPSGNDFQMSLGLNNGENQTNLRKNDILNTPLYIPPFGDQEEVVKKLDEVVSQTKSLESNYQQELDALDELKKSILQKAFNGEL